MPEAHGAVSHGRQLPARGTPAGAASPGGQPVGTESPGRQSLGGALGGEPPGGRPPGRQQRPLPQPQADYRRAPRRRGEVLERAICEAALAELAEVGYLNLSLERVAQRARTGNASLYRRWNSRAELVLDALTRTLPEPEDLPDTGSVRDDILALLRRLTARQAGPAGEAIRGVIAEPLTGDRAQTAPEKLAGFWVQQMLRLLQRGAARGQVRPAAVDPLVAGVAPAVIMHRFLTERAPATGEVLAAIVDRVIMPLIQPPSVPGPADSQG